MKINIPLNEWCLLTEDGKRLKISNRILSILLRVWKRCMVQLIPTLSPLASTVWHSLFQEVIKLDDYKKWRQEGLARFGNLWEKSSVYPRDAILHKIGESRQSVFQYRQIRLLVLVLMNEENIFRPKTELESLLLSGEKMMLLSNLYNILSLNEEPLERAKLQ